MFPEVITTNYIISQVLSLIAIVFVSFGFFQKTRTKFFISQIIANGFISISFLFLGTYFACVGVAVATIRTIIFFIFEKKNKSVPIWLVVLLCVFISANCVIFWEDVWDLLPMVSLILFTIGYKIPSLQKMRLFLLFPNVMFAVFDVIKYAYGELLLKLIEITSIIVSLIIYSAHKQKQNTIIAEEKTTEEKTDDSVKL